MDRFSHQPCSPKWTIPSLPNTPWGFCALGNVFGVLWHLRNQGGIDFMVLTRNCSRQWCCHSKSWNFRWYSMRNSGGWKAKDAPPWTNQTHLSPHTQLILPKNPPPLPGLSTFAVAYAASHWYGRGWCFCCVLDGGWISSFSWWESEDFFGMYIMEW